MLEFLSSKEFFASLIGAFATIIAVFVAINMGLKTLRDTEIRRLRIKCVIDLISYRFVLSSKRISTEAQVVFISALNAVPALFGSDATVMRLLNDFRESTAVSKEALLLNLIREVAKIADVPLTHVGDADIERPFGM